MQNIQNKIDKLITNGNDEFSKQRNVIAALVEYSRTLDLYDFMDRTYRIQIHEISVRIAICWDILGNFKNTLEYLNKALQIVPNVASLVLYKCVLLQTLGKTEEAQKTLIKYKQISGKKQQSLYETFRLVFFYSMNYERDLLLREIHEYLDKHPKNAVVLYLRAMIYMDLANPSEGRSNSSAYHKKNSSEFLLKYENDIKEAHQIEPTDTEFLMKDGITSENLTKLFFMILPEMDYYQPKPLVSYSTFHCGLKLFYIIFKVIRMLKIKVEKKKLKKFYNNKLKLYKKKLENSNTNNRDVSPDNSNNSLAIQSDNTAKESGIESANGTAINKSTTQGNTSDVAISDVNCTHNTSKDKIKLVKSRLKTSNVNTDRVPLNLRMSKNVNTIVNIKNNIEKETLDDMIKGIKKEFETKVKSLYRTVWVYNLKLGEGLTYNYEADVFTNYFIKYKYYAPFNLKESIVNGIRLNSEYKKDNSMHNISQSSMHKSPIIEKKSQIVSIKPNIPKPNEGRGLLTNGQCHNDKILVDLSVSEINYKHPPQTLEEHDSISFSSEVNILDRNESQDRKEINLNKDKLKLEKATNEITKNDGINSRKYVHKSSPRVDWQRMNTNNLGKPNREDVKLSSAHKPDSNQNNPTIDQNKTNRDGSSLRKSFDYDKNRVPEEILKKGVLQKPNLFKNLSKNMNLKLIGKNLNREPAAVKVKKSDSMISGSMSIKTNENV